MPISAETVEKLRLFSSLVCCPLCGKRDQSVESLTSCGHYLCANCLNKFVLKTESKCPKCYAINYRNDCKEDIFVNSMQKMTSKLNALLDKHNPEISESKAVSKQLAIKSNEEPKQSKKQSALIIESLKACVKTKSKSSAAAVDQKTDKTGVKGQTSRGAMAAPKSKKSFEYIDTDLDSIPDSLDNMSFTQSSSNRGDGKTVGVVDAVLHALEATNDRLSVDMSSLSDFEENSPKDKTSQEKNSESKSCQRSPNLEDRGVQTSQKSVPKTVSHSVSTQYSVQKPKQTDQSVQTVPSVETIVESTGAVGTCCESNNCCFHKVVDSVQCLSLQTFLKSLMSLKESSTKSNESSINSAIVSEAEKALNTNTNSGEVLISSDKFISTSEEVISSIEPIEEIEPKKEPIKPQTTRTTNTRTISKRAIAGPKSAKKKLKNYESSDDSSIEEIEHKVPDIEKKEEKEKLKAIEESDEELKPKKVSNRKSIGLKPQKKRSKPKSLAEDSTATDVKEVVKSEEKVPKRNANKNKTEKKTSIIESKKGLNKTSIDESNNEDMNCEEKEATDEKVESKQRTRRKAVPKRFSKVEEWDQKTENEPKVSKEVETKANPRKRQLIVEEKKDLEEIATKIRTKSLPKSKRPSIEEPIKESNKAVFKRPASPSPSESSDISIASTASSRQRTSSSERSNDKFVILSSGLNEKQTKKIQNLCRELNGEAVTDWSDKVTHLVISQVEGLPKKDMMCPRNAKYLKALLSNKWIVSFDWIIDSDRSNRFLSELKYEISADRTATERKLPKISRTSRKKLFENLSFCFDGEFGALLTDLTEFVTIGGGVVLNSINEFENKKSKKGSDKLVIVTEAIGFPNTQNNGIKYVSKKAFMDSISNFQTI